MIDVRVEIPRSANLRLARLIDGRAVRFAETQAINRTAANVSAVGLKEVSKEMGIARSKLAKRGRKRDFRGGRKYGAVNTTRKATRRRLEAIVSGRGRPFNISRFGARAIQGGAAHQAWGRSQVARGVWKLKSGAFVVRSGRSFRGVFGPGVTHVMEYPHIMEAMQREAIKRFPGHFGTALRYAFSSQFHGRR